MRKIRVFAHVSLDGVIAPGGPDDNSDFANGAWTAPYRSPAGLQALLEVQGGRFDLLLGRRTYDLWSGHWPKAGNNPMANSLNAATKHVATHRPDSLPWGPASALGADIAEGIRGLKSSDGPDLVTWGSTTVTSVLFQQGLVDEVVLLVYPLLLGQGKRLFSDSVAPRELALLSTKSTPTGVFLNTYRYVGPVQTQPAPR
jgi:dihydrofolate reductase